MIPNHVAADAPSLREQSECAPHLPAALLVRPVYDAAIGAARKDVA